MMRSHVARTICAQSETYANVLWGPENWTAKMEYIGPKETGVIIITLSPISVPKACETSQVTTTCSMPEPKDTDAEEATGYEEP